jgi:hypothetical protein
VWYTLTILLIVEMTPHHSKPVTGLRLSDEGRVLLEKLARYYRVPLAAVVEIALTELARKVGMVAPPAFARGETTKKLEE